MLGKNLDVLLFVEKRTFTGPPFQNFYKPHVEYTAVLSLPGYCHMCALSLQVYPWPTPYFYLNRSFFFFFIGLSLTKHLRPFHF